MALDSELNVTKAFMAMKTALASGPGEVDAHGVLVRANSNPLEMASDYDIRSSNNKRLQMQNSDLRMSTLARRRLETVESGDGIAFVENNEDVDL